MFVDDAAKTGDLAAQELLMPKRGSAEAAGLDLVAANETPMVLAPGRHQMIPTGIAMALPVGYEGQVRPRSGLAAEMVSLFSIHLAPSILITEARFVSYWRI